MTCTIRINPDGTIPANNNNGFKKPACWLYGLRNAFRSYWDIPSGRYFIADVGGNDQSVAVEEIYLGVNNGFYGWPVCEGACNNPDFPGGCSCATVQVSAHEHMLLDSRLRAEVHACK